MTKNERIGMNVRSLREAHCETQEELGFRLNLTKNAISNYERGKRSIPYDVLKEIATYYMVPEMVLINADLSNMEEINDKFNDDMYPSFFHALFPLKVSEEAMKNEHFKRAYMSHDSLYEMYLNNGCIDTKLVHECLNEYLDACVNNTISLEGMANLISLVFFLTSRYQQKAYTEENCPAILKKIIKDNKEYECYRKGFEVKPAEDKDNIMEVFRTKDFMRIYNSSIRLLKSNPGFSDLADFYMALSFMFRFNTKNVADDYISWFSADMMTVLMRIGNVYAIRFYEAFEMWCP